jgi:2-phospho-L-lactate guanylyltransferase
MTRTRPTWAVVPTKCFDRGKSRLAPVLDDRERAAFARALFDHVLGVLAASRRFDGILVATDCSAVADAALVHGAVARMDDAPGPLSTVVDAALADVGARGGRSALVLMADLPRLVIADVTALLDALEDNDVAIVRDVHGRHTNALALTPPDALRTCFGARESFEDHCAAARAAGLRLAVVDNAHIAFDVDAPGDHAIL